MILAAVSALLALGAVNAIGETEVDWAKEVVAANGDPILDTGAELPRCTPEEMVEPTEEANGELEGFPEAEPQAGLLGLEKDCEVGNAAGEVKACELVLLKPENEANPIDGAAKEISWSGKGRPYFFTNFCIISASFPEYFFNASSINKSFFEGSTIL